MIFNYLYNFVFSCVVRKIVVSLQNGINFATFFKWLNVKNIA